MRYQIIGDIGVPCLSSDGSVVIEPFHAGPDETHGLTIDELIPEIDAFLAEYRKSADE